MGARPGRGQDMRGGRPSQRGARDNPRAAAQAPREEPRQEDLKTEHFIPDRLHDVLTDQPGPHGPGSNRVERCARHQHVSSRGGEELTNGQPPA